MEHVPSLLQAASLGGVGAILLQPDNTHIALIATCVATLGSIVTTAINRRADRIRDDVKDARDKERAEKQFAHDKEEREFQAAQVQKAFDHASAERIGVGALIASKVQEASDASATALDVANHANEKLTRVTEALGDAVRAQK